MNTYARVLVTMAAAAALVVATVTSALATPPDTNGRIAFTRYTDASRSSGSIYTITPNGKGEQRVTRPPAGVVDFQPDWSPDGSRIVFERQVPDQPVQVWSVRPDGTDLQKLDPGCGTVPVGEICDAHSPAWAPDGRRLAVGWAFGKLKSIRGEEWIEVGSIAVVNADGSNLRQLTQLVRPTSSEDGEAVWSPDGTKLAFQRENSTARPVGQRAIFVVNVDGTGLRRVTPWSLHAGDHPDWSPDGKRILFRSPTRVFAGSNLYTVRPDGTGLTKVTRFLPTTEVLSASYSPDGKWIVFSKTGRAGLPDLFAIRTNGTGLRQITRTPAWDSSPDWGAAR